MEENAILLMVEQGLEVCPEGGMRRKLQCGGSAFGSRQVSF